MLKKLALILVAAVAALSMSARDNYSRDASVLPKAAQTSISSNFKAKVSMVKTDKDFGRVSEYEVILTDGTEITFDRDGNWKDIEVSANRAVPSAYVPANVTQYVKNNHKGQKVVGIEKDRGGYEVELSNGLDLKFDRNGNFVKYED